MATRTPLGRKTTNKQVGREALKRKAELEAIDGSVVEVPAAKKAKTQAQVTPKKAREELIEWRRKMRKSIKEYVFYFDLDAKSAAEASELVQNLGASVERFFSNSVSHVVTWKSGLDEKREKIKRQQALKAAGSPRATKPAKSSPDKNPFEDPTDVVKKALGLGIRVWPHEKFLRIVNELYDGGSPLQQTAKTPTLSYLIRAEALSGVTHERDPDASRPDFNYFAPRSYYLLVEDSCGEHKTVISKEYERPRRGESPEYPVLYGGVEGRGAFTSRDQNVPQLPPGVSPLPLPFLTEKEKQVMLPPPPLVRQPSNTGAIGNGINSLRKATMLNQFAKKQAKVAEQPKDEAHGFLAASGNSQTITSNIASVTSGALLPSNMARQDKTLALLDRRQVVTGHSNVLGVRVGLGVPLIKNKPTVKPNPARKHKPKRLGLRNPNPTRPYEPEKPGYCENCRIRYTDFKEHIVSRKHRRFALKDENWAELDDFLDTIVRKDENGYAIDTWEPLTPESQEADEMDQDEGGRDSCVDGYSDGDENISQDEGEPDEEGSEVNEDSAISDEIIED